MGKRCRSVCVRVYVCSIIAGVRKTVECIKMLHHRWLPHQLPQNVSTNPHTQSTLRIPQAWNPIIKQWIVDGRRKEGGVWCKEACALRWRGQRQSVAHASRRTLNYLHFFGAMAFAVVQHDLCTTGAQPNLRPKI